jgi:hypothetical protein
MSTPPPDDLHRIWAEIGSQVQLLTISGVAGAFFRAVMAPEQEWRRRTVQGIAGAASAIFLGGLTAHIFNAFLDVGPYAYLASGFIMGSGGELAVKAIQDRILGGKATP